MRASTSAGASPRQSTRERVTTGRSAASAGQSHWSDTPTTLRAPRPRSTITAISTLDGANFEGRQRGHGMRQDDRRALHPERFTRAPWSQGQGDQHMRASRLGGDERPQQRCVTAVCPGTPPVSTCPTRSGAGSQGARRPPWAAVDSHALKRRQVQTSLCLWWAAATGGGRGGRGSRGGGAPAAQPQGPQDLGAAGQQADDAVVRQGRRAAGLQLARHGACAPVAAAAAPACSRPRPAVPLPVFQATCTGSSGAAGRAGVHARLT